MIAEILHRPFVVHQLPKIIEALEAPETVPDASLPVGIEREEILEELRAASARENQASSMYPSFDVATGRRAEEGRIEDFAFFSHDPILSLTQSALDRFFRERQPESLIVAELPEIDRNRRSLGNQIAITNLRLKPEAAALDDATGRRLGESFSQTDIGWISSLIAEGIRLFRRRHPLPKDPSPPVALPPTCRLVLVGDWGSGLPRAIKVAAEMRKVLDQGKAAGLQQHVIHLGDVYYSGWDYEQSERFLNHWPVHVEETGLIGSWSLNGNHDMYSGGHGYFRTLLGDQRFRLQAKSNRFSFDHPHWKILGLDTSYEDHDLAGDQSKWVAENLGAARQDGKRGFLLSHHQLFSAYESGGPRLRQKLGSVLRDQLIHTWFWGHEHRCAIYKSFDDVQFARCVGHGGVPVYMNHGDEPLVPPCIWEFRDSIEHEGIEGMVGARWAKFGFAVVDIYGPAMHVRYVDEDGNIAKEEDIQ